VTPTELFLANRRDALLLLLLQGSVLAWGWERGAGAALGGSLVTAALFTLLLSLFQQSQLAAARLAKSQPENNGWWEIRPLSPAYGGMILLAVGTLPTTLLVARAVWQGLGSLPLMLLLALLTLGWQAWLSLWTAESQPPPHEEE
jgi:hypothetical protein